LESGVVADLELLLVLCYLECDMKLTEMKTIPQLCTSSSIDWLGSPPSSFNVSPLDIVRFQYFSGGYAFSFKCFWMLVAMANPMLPRPIHPKRGFSDALIL
jgi:hypothetical protein